MTMAVRRFAWSRGYALCILAGGATGIVQVNDTDLHRELKRLYQELEMEDNIFQQGLRQGCCPVPRKEDCMAWMASIWGQSWLHASASTGFKKVGFTNALDGSEDHLICREARQFWDELEMPLLRAGAMRNIEVEVAGGRLGWTFDGVRSVMVDYEHSSRRFKKWTDDEGSGDSSVGDGELSDEPDLDDFDGGDEDPPACPPAPAVVPPASLLEEGAAEDIALSLEGGGDMKDLSLVPSLAVAEAESVDDHAVQLNTLQSVLEQLRSAGAHGLMATVQNAIVHEERRARGRRQQNPAVAAAMLQERSAELALQARQRASFVLGRREESQRQKSLQDLREERGSLEQARQALHRASTLAETMSSLKSYEAKDLGQGHPKGGTAEHVRNRMHVLDRLKLRAAPLLPEQQNDWAWFKSNWDRARLRRLPELRRASWGSQFKDMVLELLDHIGQGRHDALSRWMSHQCREFLGVAALRI